ncbi:MAG: histone deacetylase [Candidatus Aminicenantes bacterium]|nr:histone deacetylase [Candidatus Aminicenantes bacterium]
MMKTGIVMDRRYMGHDMGAFHPESPRRLEAIYRMIQDEIEFEYQAIEPRPAAEEEIQWIHTRAYIDTVSNSAGKDRVVLDPDTSTSALSYEAAMLAAGGVMRAVELIMLGEVKNAFAFIRPPGHHAEASRAMGFCLFNNIAIGAEYLLEKNNLKRILIVDWDLHHGNGTQHSFYERKDVLYFSTHQFPHYPGTGYWDERGAGPGTGYTVNVPLSAGKTDQDYMYIFDTVLSPIVKSYLPEFILVSAGFDISAKDPLGGMQVSDLGFGALAHTLIRLAGQVAHNRILFALEGGYDLEGLKSGCRQVLLQMAGEAGKPSIEPAASPQISQELKPVIETHCKQWPL